MAKSLDAVVEDCVNGVGVDLNTASAPLLSRVSGLSAAVAESVVEFRQRNGAFDNRRQLLEVSRLGPKMYEQAAGFLRISHGSEPLDASSVHPESYRIVETIARDSGRDVSSLIGDITFLRSVPTERYRDAGVGELTLKDILGELEKPGRDPRPEFVTAEFREGVETLSDLKPSMILEGVVTNVTHFGAFVDIGVHQDGLVHISALSDRFVKDPREVVKAGDVVKVKVMAVDVQRKRVGLSMRLDDEPEEGGAPAARGKQQTGKRRAGAAKPDSGKRRKEAKNDAGGAMAEALRSAMKSGH
jgi:uncharacterized protein